MATVAFHEQKSTSISHSICGILGLQERQQSCTENDENIEKIEEETPTEKCTDESKVNNGKTYIEVK